MKKVIFSVVSIFTVVFVILFVFAFDNIVKVRNENSLLETYDIYSEVSLDSRLDASLSENHFDFVYGDYKYESVLTAGEIFELTEGASSFIEFRRSMLNVYDDSSEAIQYDGYITVYINSELIPVNPPYYWAIDVSEYLIKFDTRTLLELTNNIISYQNYMDENEPSLQKPVENEITENDGILEVLSKFFTNFGDWTRYIFNRISFYFNYVKFLIRDYFTNFIF